MSSFPAVRVSGLSKVYRVDVSGAMASRGAAGWYDTLVRNPLHKIRHGATHGMHTEEFSALDDINFELQQGEVLGIVGRNGAGKSTLLKILSRITDPTRGRAEIRGRVGSLLEVGTGFHNELTGRENVFLNASILGMKRSEIQSRFDSIVDFAGVEQFIDTPVKRYSSGMRVRLGFAVAAHFDPEVMIVDEVLAVGDVEFQQKCLGRMSESAKSGRTVLFVSHNMIALKNLCPRAIMLKNGKLLADGKSEDVVDKYLTDFKSIAGGGDTSELTENRRGHGDVTIERAELLTTDNEPTAVLRMGEGLVLRADVRANVEVRNAGFQISLLGEHGEFICRLNSAVMNNRTFSLDPGEKVAIRCTVPAMNLAPGSYRLSLLALGSKHIYDAIDQAISFEVKSADVYNTGQLPFGKNVIFLHGDWDFAQVPKDAAAN